MWLTLPKPPLPFCLLPSSNPIPLSSAIYSTPIPFIKKLNETCDLRSACLLFDPFLRISNRCQLTVLLNELGIPAPPPHRGFAESPTTPTQPSVALLRFFTATSPFAFKTRSPNTPSMEIRPPDSLRHLPYQPKPLPPHHRPVLRSQPALHIILPKRTAAARHPEERHPDRPHVRSERVESATP
jgi:hypothetical protein